MKSVLYIGSGAPWLDGAGYLVRQRMFLRALREVADVKLALFDVPAEAHKQLPEHVLGLTCLAVPSRNRGGRISQLASDLFSSLPRMFHGIECEEARYWVQCLRPSQFDAVFCFRIDFAYFAGVLGHDRLLLDVDDPEHKRWRRRLEAKGQATDRRTRHDLRKLERFEQHAVAGARASFICHEGDTSAFLPKPIVVPNCVDVPDHCPPREVGKQRVMMLGNFSASESPNTDGLIWFLQEIWPLIIRALPECEFHAVGPMAQRPRQVIERTPGAKATGFVPDLRRAFAQASVSVAPIRYGTGTRIKILEAFAQGCPVVSTSIGREGIEAQSGRDLWLADDPAQFAEHCVALVNDRGEQQRFAQAGHRLAGTFYSESARRAELASILADLLRRCESPRNSTDAPLPQFASAVAG